MSSNEVNFSSVRSGSTNRIGNDEESSNRRGIHIPTPAELAAAASKQAANASKAAQTKLMNELNNLKVSRFRMWTREELIQKIIDNGLELRDEKKLNTLSLRDLLEMIYEDQPTPEKPKVFSQLPPEYQFKISRCVRHIQDRWIKYQFRLRMEAKAREMDEKSNIHDKLEDVNIDWVPPSWEKAKLSEDFINVRKFLPVPEKDEPAVPFQYWKTTTGRHCCLGSCGEQIDLWNEGKVSEFFQFGVGISNYFKFLKWCAWVYLILAIINLPSLVINFYGPQQANFGLSNLAQTTAGNLGSFEANDTMSVNIPGCYNYGFSSVSCTVDKKSIAELYCWLDVASCIFIMIAWFWLRHWESDEIKSEESHIYNTNTAADYTVIVKGLPRAESDDDVRKSEMELREHFSKLINKNNSGKIESKIVDINYAFSNNFQISVCMERGRYVNEQRHLAYKYKYDCTNIRHAPLDKANKSKKLTELKTVYDEKYHNLQTKIVEKDRVLAQIDSIQKEPIAAFITFNEISSKEAVLDAYNMRYDQWLFMPSELRLRGKRINVKGAPDPSTILWENLEFSWWSRFKRRSAVTLVALMIIIISVIVTYGENVLANKTIRTYNTDTLCPESFTTYTREEQVQYVADYGDDYLHCYCDILPEYRQARDNLCQDYLKSKVRAQFLNYFASLIVIFVNALLELFISYMTSVEMHHSDDSQASSLFVRLFVLKYINTSCVFLINNNPTIMKSLGVGTSTDIEFSGTWYSTIGVTILLVQLNSIIIPHMYPLFQVWMRQYRLYRAKKNPSLVLDQATLDKMHEGIKFNLDVRYANLLATFFVCLTYSVGMPLLNAVAFANFIVYYFIDKYLFVKYCKRPNHFNGRLGRNASSLIPYAVLIHLCVSIWALSNSNLFAQVTASDNYGVISGSTTTAKTSSQGLASDELLHRITLTSTLPLFVLFLLLSTLKLELLTGKTLRKFVGSIIYGLCGDLDSKDRYKNTKEKQVKQSHISTYNRAVERNIIKGVVNYNILQNPKYREFFGITWKFALSHRRIGSVRLSTPDRNEVDASIAIDVDEDIDAHTVQDTMRHSEKRSSFKWLGQTPMKQQITTTTTTAPKYTAAKADETGVSIAEASWRSTSTQNNAKAGWFGNVGRTAAAKGKEKAMTPHK